MDTTLAPPPPPPPPPPAAWARPPVAPPEPRPRRPLGRTIAIVLLGVAVLATGAAGVGFVVREGGDGHGEPAAAATARFRGTARSLAFAEAQFGGIEKATFGVRPLSEDEAVGDPGLAAIEFSGTVTDASGTERSGLLLLELQGSTLKVTGDPMEVRFGAADQQVILEPGGLAIEATGVVPSGTVRLTSDGGFRVRDFSGERYDDVDSLKGPVTIAIDEGEGADLWFFSGRFTWQDRPERFQLTGASMFSWAGDGTITPPGGTPASGAYAGLAFDAEARDASIDVRLVDDHYEVSGSGAVRQAYVDGRAILRTRGSVELHTPELTIPTGGAERFTWEPRNNGDFDMTIEGVAATTPEGRWVELALDPLPAMAGGQDFQAGGGDTDFIQRGGVDNFFEGFIAVATVGIGLPFAAVNDTKTILSVLGPGQSEERDITVHVPEGTAPGTYTVGLQLQGNFAPIDVAVAIHVT